MSPETAAFFFLLLAIGVSSDEVDLLLNLKSALLPDSNTKLFDSWRLNNSICNFSGITCDDKGSVKEINLENQNLSGEVPFDSICQLQSLQRLSLGFNYLRGNLTDDLNKCSRLRYLDLGNNFFSGVMPDIHSMNGLRYLYVNNSGFSGTFPWDSLETMTGLLVLSVGDNSFDQTPFPEQVLKLTNLTWLYMSNCSIGGQIPAGIGELTELINFEISSNYITGEIPSEISKLVKLWQLELFDNNLTGKLPVGLRNLTNLQNFDASMNYIEGDLSEVGFLTQLKSLQLFENKLTGEIPPEIGDEFKQLVNLSLYRNQLTGTLPQQLGSWSDFNFIDVSENLLTGQIPPNMCKKKKMTGLFILDNNFTGPIPASYADCKTLSRFRVSNNMLSGVVPGGIWGLPAAEIIDIENNSLEGSITSDIQNAKTLGQIFAAHNRLSGELPVEISMATSLNTIDLSRNQFSGKIPATIGDLKHLDSLHLDNNKFSGQIPNSLGACDSLNDINMAYNSFSGKIPAALGWLQNLNSLNLSSNKLHGEIPSSLASLRLSLLDLSHNQLAGAIPESLSIDAYNGSFAGNTRLCSQKVKKYFRPCYSDGVSSEIQKLVTCLSVGSAVALVLLAYLCYIKNKKKKYSDEGKDDSWNVKSFHVLSGFLEDEIIDSIKEENLIGRGASGQVYRVSLKNGMELAVKHMRTTSNSYSMKKDVGRCRSLEFEAEVETLSSIRHVNVVKLYSSITSQDEESRLLVYEYLANGSLWDRLHGASMKKLGGLDWLTRYEIAVGAAKGLEYLHHGCERPVIHRDVKSSNILLDEDFKPRIADFGLAKIGQTLDTTSTHVIAGTHGYIAPEYGYTYRVNEKSDVYSFGVVLMELVTGKKAIEVEYGENKDIVYWVCSKLKNKESVLSLVDSSIDEAYKEDTIKVLKIGIMCTSRLPTLRPTMRAVVKMLEEAQPSSSSTSCNKLIDIVVTKDKH